MNKENIFNQEFELSRLHEITHIGSWRLDIAKNKVWWTKELYLMFGFDPNLPPPPFTEHMKLFTKESWDLLSSSLDHTAKTGEAYELELKTVKKDGSNGWLWVRGEALKDKSGNITGLWGVAQDITKRKQEEEELKASRNKALENEKRIQQILDHMMEGYQIVDFDYRYIFLNKVAEKHSMMPSDSLIGKTMMQAYPGIEKTRLFEMITDSLTNRTPNQLDNQFEYPNGDTRWFSISIQPMPQGVSILSNDITEKKKAEIQLLEEKRKLEINKEQLSKAQRTAKVGSWILNINNNKLEWSDEMFHIFEIDKDSFSGDLSKIIEQYVIPEDREIIIRANQSIQKKGYFDPVEHRIKTKSGKLKYLYGEAHHLEIDKTGNKQIISGIVKDVTESKNIQLELKKAKEKAEESNRLKSAFLANMSHEIRTPMNSIVGFAEFLKDPEKTRPEINRYADIILKGGHHLLNLINDIIDISKIDAGQMSIHQTTVDINALLKEKKEFYQSDLISKEKYNVHIKLNIPNEKCLVYTDETRLRQILFNLIGNAVKFTEEGYIEIGYKREDKQLKFWVKDSGIGIPKSEQENIFQRFRQASHSTEKLYGGTGLGLAIAKSCSQLLKGDLWLESEEGKGAHFYFNIEYLPSKEKASIHHIRKRKPKYHFDHQKILIAEDTEDNFLLYEEMLNPFNLEIKRANNGIEALEMVLQEHFDLLLLDIHMPELSGDKAIMHIRKHQPLLPVIAQTAYALNNDMEKFLALGFDDYLAKPFSQKKLLDMIVKYI